VSDKYRSPSKVLSPLKSSVIQAIDSISIVSGAILDKIYDARNSIEHA